MRALKVLAWRVLAALCVALGAVGVFVPGLPTVPFLLVAAWAAGRGWPALEEWLLNHATHGPAIRRWRERGAVPRRAKWAATLMMTMSSVLLWFTPAPIHAKWALPALLLAVAVWLWRRPEA